MNDPVRAGGPAFPQTTVDGGLDGVGKKDGVWHWPGMTLRDYLAAAALQGLCANPGGPFQANDRSGWGLVNCSTFDIAGSAYDIADAMLEARLK